jgi:hypothetical protein
MMAHMNSIRTDAPTSVPVFVDGPSDLRIIGRFSTVCVDPIVKVDGPVEERIFAFGQRNSDRRFSQMDGHMIATFLTLSVGSTKLL